MHYLILIVIEVLLAFSIICFFDLNINKIYSLFSIIGCISGFIGFIFYKCNE